MKNIYLINFYKEKKEEKIKKYEIFLKEIMDKNFNLKIINEGDKIKNPYKIILSGSQKMVGDGEVDFKYMEKIFSFNVPVLGICYGHQALSKFFKAEVKKAKKEHKGFEEIHLYENSKIFDGFSEKFEMYESHFEEVLETKEFLKNFKIIGKNSEGGIEAVEGRNLKFFGCQFHPEESLNLGKKFLFNFLFLV